MKQATKKPITQAMTEAAAVIRYHDIEPKDHPDWRLPMHAGKSTPEHLARHRNWALPATGGYGSGCQAGEYAAVALLKHWCTHRDYGGGSLQHYFFDLAARLNEATTEIEKTALRGQAVGFFVQLEGFAAAAARHLNHKLRELSEDEICAKLQDAADGGPDCRWEEKLAEGRRETARAAALARWAKHRDKLKAQKAA